MQITILVEGRTGRTFKIHLLEFLRIRIAEHMLRMDFCPCNGRNCVPPTDAVIALTDINTGTNEFADATAAKRKMLEPVGKNDKFHPHAAQHDFEAWLLPYSPPVPFR